MSTADDDVLATNGGPDDANTRAELAVLDMALSERFGDRAPRDLWPGTAARLLRARSATPTRMQPWLLAAGMLLGLGVVTAVAVWRPAPAPNTPTAAPDSPSDGTDQQYPTDSLAELQARVALATEMRLQVGAIWSGTLGRWVAVNGQSTTGSWGAVTTIAPDLVAEICTAIEGARLAPSTDADPASGPWSHQLTFDSSASARLMVRLGGGRPPAVGYQTGAGVVVLEVPRFPFPALLPAAERCTKTAIAARGIVLGAEGFAAVSITAKQMQLHDVPTNAIGELIRYTNLQALDLTPAPTWHDALVLQALEKHQLAELALLPDRLDASAFRALGQLHTLRELSLTDRPPYDLFREPRSWKPAANLDDTAMRALSELQRVSQLTLTGGTFTDHGLRALRTMPLKSLALFGCEGVRGSTFAALPLVRQLVVRGSPLGSAAAEQLAAMPELQELWLSEDAASIPLAPLVAAKHLRMIALRGPVQNGALLRLAGLATLRDLLLQPTSPLSELELRTLQGLKQLNKLSVVGATELQCTALREALPGTKVTNVW